MILKRKNMQGFNKRHQLIWWAKICKR